MNVFPVLSSAPIYPLNEQPVDDIIRSTSEAGYEMTRARFTRVRLEWEGIRYTAMPQADKNALVAFYAANRASVFQWTHPKTNVVYNVRFTSFKTPLPQYAGYDFEFSLREA